MKLLSYRTDSLNILVVDDDQLVLRVVQAVLAADGHHIEIVTNGVDALAEFASHHWDVVLTDRAIPIMTGPEVALEIKRLSPQTPVIMITGYADQLVYPGVDTILKKPFRREDLAEVITAALAKYGAYRTEAAEKMPAVAA